jgi:MFS family permease
VQPFGEVYSLGEAYVQGRSNFAPASLTALALSKHGGKAWGCVDRVRAAHGPVVKLGHDLEAHVLGEGLDGCPLALVAIIVGADIICLVMIANLQYGWSLFVNPIDQKYHYGRAAIQVSFTIFVLTETWLVPLEGYLIDRFGPRVMVCASGVLVAFAWALNSVADSLMLLYVGAAIGGIGAGVIYGASVGNALKWFPDRRGLAAGLTAAGFGAGSALTVIPIANIIGSSGYQQTFLWFGLGQGIVVMVVGLLLRAPQAGEAPIPVAPRAKENIARRMGELCTNRRDAYTASFKSFAARKAIFLLALILMASPVAGLRPIRAGRLRTCRMPRPTILMRLPFFRCLVISLIMPVSIAFT